MGLSRWHRFGYWLETFGLGRRLVLREVPSTARFLEPWDSGRMMRVEAVNRINGHVVVIHRRPR